MMKYYRTTQVLNIYLDLFTALKETCKSVKLNKKERAIKIISQDCAKQNNNNFFKI